MIISKQKSIEQILKSMAGFKKIFILGCGTCSTTCKSGGEPEVARVKEALINSGKEVTGSAVCETPCVSSQVKITFAKNRAALTKAEAILALACGSGVQCVKANDRLGLRVLPGCDTLFAAAVDEKGSFNEWCSHCADCVLDMTGAICPITRCAKGLLNGPCGGMNKGKCEVNKEEDCVWVLIHQQAVKDNSFAVFKSIQAPKDYSKTVKPHKLNLENSPH